MDYAVAFRNGHNPGSTLRCIPLTVDNTRACTNLLLISLSAKYFTLKK